jgi:hypothetical protein
VAAIAILGVILVGFVLAKSRHTHQIALAERQSVAVRAADALLAEWWKSAEGVPVDEWGSVEDDPSLVWETCVVRNIPIERLRARVVRVEIYDAASRRPTSDDTEQQARFQEPFVAVELVLPQPDRDASEEGRRE